MQRAAAQQQRTRAASAHRRVLRRREAGAAACDPPRCAARCSSSAAQNAESRRGASAGAALRACLRARDARRVSATRVRASRRRGGHRRAQTPKFPRAPNPAALTPRCATPPRLHHAEHQQDEREELRPRVAAENGHHLGGGRGACCGTARGAALAGWPVPSAAGRGRRRRRVHAAAHRMRCGRSRQSAREEEARTLVRNAPRHRSRAPCFSFRSVATCSLPHACYSLSPSLVVRRSKSQRTYASIEPANFAAVHRWIKLVQATGAPMPVPHRAVQPAAP